MVITTTSAAFLVLGLGLAFCGWRFLRAFERTGGLKSGRKIGFLLTVFLFGFAFQTGVILSLGNLLFGSDPNHLTAVLVVANVFLTALAIFGIYTAYYIFSPETSPWPLMAAAGGLGILAFVLAFTAPPSPFVTSGGSVEWNMSFPLGLATFYLLFLSIGAQFYIFARLFFQAVTREIRILSFSLALFALVSIIDQFGRFVLLYGASAEARARLYDIVHALIGLGFLILLVVLPLLRRRLAVRSGGGKETPKIL